jgi:hypothetical protein
MYSCVKRNKRLWIVYDNQLVYTPPDFIRCVDRQLMIQLAATATAAGLLTHEAIAAFEAAAPRAVGYTPRKSKELYSGII